MHNASKMVAYLHHTMEAWTQIVSWSNELNTAARKAKLDIDSLAGLMVPFSVLAYLSGSEPAGLAPATVRG